MRLDVERLTLGFDALAHADGQVVFVPYGDQRWAEHEVAGSLGLGFFARYDVWANFREKTLYLVPREPHPIAKRIARRRHSAHVRTFASCLRVDGRDKRGHDEGELSP